MNQLFILGLNPVKRNFAGIKQLNQPIASHFRQIIDMTAISGPGKIRIGGQPQEDQTQFIQRAKARLELEKARF